MIDWSRVMELRSEIGEDDFEEVVELFLEEVDEVILRLRDGVDTDALEPEMHFLKGSALNLGFEDFSNLCAQGEKLAASGEGKSFDLSEVFQVYDGSRAMFLEQLPAQTGA